MRTPAILCAATALCACSKQTDEETTGPSTPPVVEIVTSKGAIRVQLDPAKAPITVENFLDYVVAGHYDGTIFHRVMKEFMIQGGGFGHVEGGMPEERQTRGGIRNEARNGLTNKRGTIAMARTADPDSATAQFFINVVDNTPNLGPGGVSPDGYAVFGEVISGMDVVDAIRKVETNTAVLKAMTSTGDLAAQPMGDVPVESVVIESIRKVEP